MRPDEHKTPAVSRYGVMQAEIAVMRDEIDILKGDVEAARRWATASTGFMVGLVMLDAAIAAILIPLWLAAIQHQ